MARRPDDRADISDRYLEWYRMADVVALCKVDAVLVQELGGRVIADELGNRPLAEASSNSHDRGDHQTIGGVVQTVDDELAVDLEVVER
jgi:hypothetical protein